MIRDVFTREQEYNRAKQKRYPLALNYGWKTHAKMVKLRFIYNGKSAYNGESIYNGKSPKNGELEMEEYNQ